MTGPDVQRKLAAILSTDVKGYSRLMGDDEVATVKTITAYREVISDLVRRFRGRVVDSPGDNLLAEFDSAVDAVKGAIQVQDRLKELNAELPVQRRMEFRIGINVGDVIIQEGRLYGDGVNIAARLEGLSRSGGICISGTVYDQVKNKLGLGYAYLGEQQVKNIADPVRAYRVAWGEETVETVRAQGTLKSLGQVPAGTGGGGLAVPDKPSIAVMPLRNLSPNPEEDYFSDGLTEDIITDLSKISGLFVIARNSVMAYKGQNILPLQVAGELGVRHILEGSVRRAGQRVRISTQLVDAPLSQNVWAERFDGLMEDIFDLQDQVARKIVDALKVKLTKGEEERLARQTTVNPEAYDLVHKANKLGLISSYESHLEARELYERALTLDPDYAPAHVGLGWTYFDEWPFGWSESPEVLDKALELGWKSLALDDSQTDARQLISCAYLWQLKHDQAEKAIREVLALAPGNADALSFLGYILTFAGRPEEALEPLQAAIRLDPKVPVRYRFYLGLALLTLGRPEEAVEELERCLAGNQAYIPAWATLARAYVVSGRMERAGEAMRTVKKINPDNSIDRFGPKLPYKDPAALEEALAELRLAEKA